MIRYTPKALPEASPPANKTFTQKVPTSADVSVPTVAVTAATLLEAESPAILMPAPEPLELSSELPPKKASKRPAGEGTKRKTTTTQTANGANTGPLLMLNLDA